MFCARQYAGTVAIFFPIEVRYQKDNFYFDPDIGNHITIPVDFPAKAADKNRIETTATTL